MKSLRKKAFTSVKSLPEEHPLFPIHALTKGVESSPGTIILWDYGYSSSFTIWIFYMLQFCLHGLSVNPQKICYASISDIKQLLQKCLSQGLRFWDLVNYTIVGHNEEHMVIRTPEADKYKTGDHLYGIPWHICPTVDRHDTVTVVINNHGLQDNGMLKQEKERLQLINHSFRWIKNRLFLMVISILQ